MPTETSEVRGTRPRSLIVTTYGLFARAADGWFSVGALIRLMNELGVEEAAVRSSISRLKRRGILESRRVGGRAGYALSDHARGILDEGDRRIFSQPRAALDDGWLLAVFSVPESERRQRHLLRSRLTWLGFGSVSSGVWIAPRHVETQARAALSRDDLLGYIDLFAADYLNPEEVRHKVSRWWDLAALDGLYREFDHQFAPAAARWSTDGGADGEAFADYVRALTNWRRLPYLDPGLPSELLPDDWAGVRAEHTFQVLRGHLSAPAARFVSAVRTA